AAPNLLDHGGRSCHQQAAQDLVAGTGDLAKPGLAGGGVVFRGQPEPGREVPAGGERAWIGRLHHQRRGADRSHPGICASRRLAALARCQAISLASIAFSSACTWAYSLPSIANSSRASAGKLSSCAIRANNGSILSRPLAAVTPNSAA